MHINGIGNENTHNSDMHQVTRCMHNHSVPKKSGGAAASSSEANTLQTVMSQYREQEGQFSLAAWLKNALSGGRSLLHRIWGENANATTAETPGDKAVAGTEQVMAQVGAPRESDLHTVQNPGISAQEAAASATVRPQNLHNNPYFSTVEDGEKAKRSIWNRMRIRFQSMTGQLAKQFSGRNTFQTKQQKPREDLRRHSRYREDDLEIDCILTDDSYLLDSYDRKGEYSKLSAKK